MKMWRKKSDCLMYPFSEVYQSPSLQGTIGRRTGVVSPHQKVEEGPKLDEPNAKPKLEDRRVLQEQACGMHRLPQTHRQRF
jgi:hypothetical protein